MHTHINHIDEWKVFHDGRRDDVLSKCVDSVWRNHNLRTHTFDEPTFFQIALSLLLHRQNDTAKKGNDEKYRAQFVEFIWNGNSIDLFSIFRRNDEMNVVAIKYKIKWKKSVKTFSFRNFHQMNKLFVFLLWQRLWFELKNFSLLFLFLLSIEIRMCASQLALIFDWAVIHHRKLAKLLCLFSFQHFGWRQKSKRILLLEVKRKCSSKIIHSRGFRTNYGFV